MFSSHVIDGKGRPFAAHSNESFVPFIGVAGRNLSVNCGLPEILANRNASTEHVQILLKLIWKNNYNQHIK